MLKLFIDFIFHFLLVKEISYKKKKTRFLKCFIYTDANEIEIRFN